MRNVDGILGVSEAKAVSSWHVIIAENAELWREKLEKKFFPQAAANTTFREFFILLPWTHQTRVIGLLYFTFETKRNDYVMWGKHIWGKLKPSSYKVIFCWLGKLLKLRLQNTSSISAQKLRRVFFDWISIDFLEGFFKTS